MYKGSKKFWIPAVALTAIIPVVWNKYKDTLKTLWSRYKFTTNVPVVGYVPNEQVPLIDPENDFTEDTEDKDS